jgi:D-isomer specific 2-hydroxyacid dehydrogenase, catalytic domain
MTRAVGFRGMSAVRRAMSVGGGSSGGRVAAVATVHGITPPAQLRYHRLLVGSTVCVTHSSWHSSPPTTTTRCSWLSTSATAEKKESFKNWADPVARQYKYWNPHDDSKKGQYSFLLEMSPESIVKEAKIISLSDPHDPANVALHQALSSKDTGTNTTNSAPSLLPLGAQLLAIGTTVADIQAQLASTTTRSSSSSSVAQQQPNVLFVSPSCPSAAKVLPRVLEAFPSLEWIHVRSAGIDFVESDELAAWCTKYNVHMTNAKGQFSSSLAEYALAACSYFAKDFARLVRQQQAKQWINYDIQELYVCTSVYV